MALAFGLLAVDAMAVTQYKLVERKNFVLNLSELKGSLDVPVRDSVTMVKIPYDKMRIRIQKGDENNSIEPLSVYVPRDFHKLRTMVETLAKVGKVDALEQSMLRAIAESNKRANGDRNKESGEIVSGEKVKVILTTELFDLMKYETLATVLGKPHHQVIVETKRLHRQPKVRRRLVRQLRGFLSKSQRQAVIGKLKAGQDLDLDKTLLPDFARNMIRRFLVYRGPNCFHAAMAFHGQRFTKSALFNVKEERGYHRAMINYDELWRILASNFYEVDMHHSQLKYGDLLVFMDLPERFSADQLVNFRWIRHTATYLFGDYTFSKGSKSPSTPYTIKTLAEEWKTWDGYSKNLGVKVFRRSFRAHKNRPPFDLTDWMY